MDLQNYKVGLALTACRELDGGFDFVLTAYVERRVIRTGVVSTP